MEYDLEVLSLGAGVQSTCMALMAIHGDLPMPDYAIFADTGWEPKATYKHLERLRGALEDAGIPLLMVAPEGTQGLRQDVLNYIDGEKKSEKTRVASPPFFIGDGGMLWRECTREYKVDPIRRKIRELLGYKPRQRVKKVARCWIGISLDEVTRMKDSGIQWVKNWHPLIENRMDRNNCQKYMQRHGWVDVPKSACCGCPYRSNASWRDLKDNHTEDWDDAVEFDDKIREKPYPLLKGEPYLHGNQEPLSEVDLSTAEDHGQLNLFENECEGMCGV